jgi:hypothetical protein
MRVRSEVSGWYGAAMDLTLWWRGPVGPERFPTSGDAPAALAAPGIYLRVKPYEGDGAAARTVSYVGQSKQLIVRFDQHLRDILTFSSALRDRTGAIALARDVANRYQTYNELEAVMVLVTAEAARLRFYWAACEDGFDAAYFSLIEGALKARLEVRVAGGEAFACENKQGIGEAAFDEDIVVSHLFDALGTEDAVLLADLMGGDPLHLTVPLAELDHVE